MSHTAALHFKILKLKNNESFIPTHVSNALYLFWCWGAMVVGKLPPGSPWNSVKAWSTAPAFGASWNSWKSSSSALVACINMSVCKKWITINQNKTQNYRLCYLCSRETGDEVGVCGCLSLCNRSHGHDWWCWCGHGHGHGDRGFGHHGLLVLGQDRSHGHSQGREVGHWWRRELIENFHIHCWEATLKQRKQV